MLFKRLFSKFRYGDTVIVRSTQRSDRLWMSQPLTEGERVNIGSDFIQHETIVGSKSRNIIKSKDNNSYIITQPSLEDYVTLSKRAAQPIYPFDASSIVTLADLIVDFPELTEENTLKNSPLQFLEAGTGHGSLTLAICSRIHPGNCFYEKFGQRGVILHSIDCNEAHSNRGKKNVQNFRRGIYKNDVEFHLSESPTQWLLNESTEWRNLEKHEETDTELDRKEFLSGAFLDMADIVPNLHQVALHLKQDSPLIVFSPSITQLLDVLKEVKNSDGEIKLTHIRTIQLVPGAGGGLQDWDLRFSNVRATGSESVVCRPRVGSKIVGGGFVAVFKKLPNTAILKKVDSSIKET